MNPLKLTDLNQVLVEKNPERAQAMLDFANLLNAMYGNMRKPHPYLLGDCVLNKMNMLRRNRKPRRAPVSKESGVTGGEATVTKPKIYSVVGNHPILARPDKHGLTFNEAVAYSEELTKAGFEGVTIRESSTPPASTSAVIEAEKPVEVKDLDQTTFDDNLPRRVHKELLPTPLAKTSGPDYARQDREQSGGDDLVTRVHRMLPTPNARDYKDTSGSTRNDPDHAYNDDQLPRLIFGAVSPATIGGARLSPEFLCWLMGFPTNWLKPLVDAPAMQSSRKRSCQSSKP